jgi:hypothetical protein
VPPTNATASCDGTSCGFACNAGYVLEAGACRAAMCTPVADPANSTICAGDATGLTVDTAKTAVAACSAPKCQYTCSAGYVLDTGSCRAAVCTPVADPTNSTICAGDNTGLTADTAKTVVATCSAPKCQYTCSAGYQDNDLNGTCLAACAAGTCNSHGTCVDTTGTAVCTCTAGYTGAACATCAAGYVLDSGACRLAMCTGTTPTDCVLCTGDATGLTVDVAKTLVATCGAPKCEYSPAPGYTIDGWGCRAAVCTGTTPTNSAMCTGDSTGLTADVAKTLVTTCGAPMCEYRCNAGYVKNGAVCDCVGIYYTASATPVGGPQCPAPPGGGGIPSGYCNPNDGCSNYGECLTRSSRCNPYNALIGNPGSGSYCGTPPGGGGIPLFYCFSGDGCRDMTHCIFRITGPSGTTYPALVGQPGGGPYCGTPPGGGGIPLFYCFSGHVCDGIYNCRIP